MYKKIDLEEVKKALADMPADGSLRKELDKVPFLKMKQGQNKIRILPALDGSKSSLPYVERLQHGPFKYMGKYKFYTCAQSAGFLQTECPLCSVGDKPKANFLLNVVNREDGETYVWQTGISKIKTINLLLLNAPDMFDIDTGFDVMLEARGPADKSRRYNGPNLLPRQVPANPKKEGYNLDSIAESGFNKKEMQDLADYINSTKETKDDAPPF